MTLAGSVQVLVPFIFVSVPLSLPTLGPLDICFRETQRIRKIRWTPYLFSDLCACHQCTFRLECLHSVVYSPSHRGYSSSFDTNGDFPHVRSGAPGKKPAVIAGASSHVRSDRYAITKICPGRSLYRLASTKIQRFPPSYVDSADLNQHTSFPLSSKRDPSGCPLTC
jgi:hypothetical protein